METHLILWACAGWLSFWVVRIPATIISSSPINTVADFVKANWKQIFLSLVGLLLLCTGAQDLPTSVGSINGAFTAFIAGGTIPSIVMETLGLFMAKNTGNNG